MALDKLKKLIGNDIPDSDEEYKERSIISE